MSDPTADEVTRILNVVTEVAATGFLLAHKIGFPATIAIYEALVDELKAEAQDRAKEAGNEG